MEEENLIEVKIEKINSCKDVPFPSQAHPGEDVGYDLHYVGRKTIIWPFTRKMLSANCKMAMPKGICGHVRGRSGLAKKGIWCYSGTVDPGFRGQIKVVLCNFSFIPRVFRKGDRIAQLVFHKYEEVEWKVVDKLPIDSERGESGFGSTGVGQSFGGK